MKKQRSAWGSGLTLLLALPALSIGLGILYLAWEGRGGWDHDDFLLIGGGVAALGVLLSSAFIGARSRGALGALLMLLGLGGLAGGVYQLRLTREARRSAAREAYVPPIDYATGQLCRTGEGIAKARPYAAESAKPRALYIQGVETYDYTPPKAHEAPFKALFASAVPELEVVACVRRVMTDLGACPGDYEGRTLLLKREDLHIKVYQAQAGRLLGEIKQPGPPPEPCPMSAKFYEDAKSSWWFTPHPITEAHLLKPLLTFIEPNAQPTGSP
ncbi:hypothetical protein KKF91_00270 [Myxococcota bacterium]|nr:hypothetical protein [Myxococcota bacterium]